MPKITTEEIINAYKETGSVWKSGKKLGLAGQTVHERLVAANYKLVGANWTDEEVAELKELVNHFTIAQIANRLGRPYNGVAGKISKLGLGNRFGNKGSKKPVKRTFNKQQIKEFITEFESLNTKITTFAKQKGLPIENIVHAIQRHFPEWWESFAEKAAVKPKQACPYCETQFWPMSAKQIYCTRACATQARSDRDYFGGRRRETIGWAEQTCQMCARQNVPGLSSHHVLGKENDPDNEYLIALCRGCHNVVTQVANRNFAATPEAWEVLIQLVIMRKNGANKDMKAVYASVEIDILTDADLDEG